MSVKSSSPTLKHRIRATLSSRHAITLPAEIRQQLDIGPGDEIELVVQGQSVTLQKASRSGNRELQGMLEDYFTDRADVQTYLEHERSGWDT